MDVQMNQQISFVVDVEGQQVVCMRYCLVFLILLLVGMVVDPLSRLFPGFLLAKLLCFIWTQARR